MYKNLFFDLDGTLSNPTEGIINSLKYGLAKLDIPLPSDKILQTFIGPPLKDSLMHEVGLAENVADKAIQYFREYFAEKGLYENYLYRGIPELLAVLSQEYNLFVATSKPEKYAKQILEHFALSQYFTGIYGATMDSTRSKKGDVICYALASETITDLATCLMIGDTKYDIYGAHENGIASVGVLWGMGDKASLEQAQATFIIEKPNNLKDIVSDSLLDYTNK